MTLKDFCEKYGVELPKLKKRQIGYYIPDIDNLDISTALKRYVEWEGYIKLDDTAMERIVKVLEMPNFDVIFNTAKVREDIAQAIVKELSQPQTP